MADITFNCPYCEQKIEAPEEMADTKAECPSCQCELQIPKQSEPKPASPPPVPFPTPAVPASTPAPEFADGRQPSLAPHFVAAKCPSCGGDLQVPDNRDQVKCMYCGGTVITRQAIQLASSGVNVANLMELAKAAADASNPKEAYDYYTKVLEHDSRNTTAWVGKGTAAGWMSTLRDIKTVEMVAAFNNAIKYAEETEKGGIRIHAADVINRVTSTCFGMAKKHLVQFAKVSGIWPEYVQQCRLLLSALEVGHIYDPNNKTTIENIIHISADNFRGFGVETVGFGLLEMKFHCVPSYKALLKSKIDEYTAKMYRLDPGFIKPKI